MSEHSSGGIDETNRFRSALGPFGGPSLFKYVQPVILLAIMWVLRVVDMVLPISFTRLWGLQSWDFGWGTGLVLGPLLHSSWAHLIGNTVPFLVLGLLVAFEGTRRYWLVTVTVAVVSGLGTWFLNAPGTTTVGASGLVFGYFAYLVARAFVGGKGVPHRILYVVVAVVVVLLYGASMLVGALPWHVGISWQAHVFGALGGVVAAYAFAPRVQEKKDPLEDLGI